MEIEHVNYHEKLGDVSSGTVIDYGHNYYLVTNCNEHKDKTVVVRLLTGALHILSDEELVRVVHKCKLIIGDCNAQ